MQRISRGRRKLENSKPNANTTLGAEPYYSRDERRMAHRAPIARGASAPWSQVSQVPSIARTDLQLTFLTHSQEREITVNERNSVLALPAELERTLQITALLSQATVEKPTPTEIDELTRVARKALVEARNLRTKDRAHPLLVVSVFDQVSHALTRFAPPSVDHAIIVREAASTAAHATRSAHLAPEVLAQGLQELFYEAASVLANVATAGASVERTDAAKRTGRAGLWLLQATAALVKQAPTAAKLAAGITDEMTPVTATKAAPSSKNGSTEKEVAMKPQTEKNPMLEKIQLEATDAAWRTAGSQFVKLTREPLVGLLTRHLAPGDDAFRARAAVFLETELGGAILASLLSAALSTLPSTAGEVPQKLARELRVRAMSETGDVLADLLMGPLRQVIALYLQDPSAVTENPAMAALPQGQGATLPQSETVRDRVGVER